MFQTNTPPTRDNRIDFSHDKTRHLISTATFVNVLVSVWLSAVFLAQNAPDELVSYAALSAILLLPGTLLLLGFRTYSFNLFHEGSALEKGCIGVFVVTAFIGGLISIDPMTSVAFLAITLFIFCVAYNLWEMSPEGTTAGLASYSMIGVSLILLLTFLIGFDQGERLSSFRNPNSIGLLAYGVGILALGIRNIPFKWIIFGLAAAIVFWTESRSSLVGFTTAFIIFAVSSWHQSKFSEQFVISIAGIVGTCVALFYSSEIYQLLAQALAFDDAYRGLNTGFTGRDALWAYAIDLFIDNPFFGVGYRLHEQYYFRAGDIGDMEYYLAGSAHNGYLATLAETGLLGSIPLAVWLVLRLTQLVRLLKSRNPMLRIGLPLVLGYLTIAIFERYLLNLGNPTSVAVILYLCIPKKFSPKKAAVNA